jgi:hypothetical protein
MADWFKFYENDLDETRLQYAISKLPEVIPVWVGILSEACRHKVGTVSWGSDEIELFGFSRRLGVSVPKVNEAVNLLVEIRYISKEADSITVLKWGEKQSEYCQKRTKQQNQTGLNNHNFKPVVPTVSRQCPDSVGQEERRGEEKRREQPNTPDGFEDFWKAYPKKVGRGDAAKKFKAASAKVSTQEMMKALESQKRTPQWMKDGGQFIPNPSKWLNQERWLDAVVEVRDVVGGNF